MIRVCCHPDCHKVIDADCRATGERLSDAQYNAHDVSHGYCVEHYMQTMQEIENRRARNFRAA